MGLTRLALIVASTVCLATSLSFAAAPAERERIVCLGDSITDGQTYALLVQQALREAGRPVPRMIGAGIGGDNAVGMLAGLTEMFSRDPDMVMVADSINDSGKPVDEFERVIRALAAIKAKGIPIMLFTSTTVAPGHAAIDSRLAEFNALLRQIAKEDGYRLCDVNATMQAAGADAKLWEDDGIHLSFEGYRLMSRAVLYAMGHPDVAVPAEMKLGMLPGVVREWKVRAVADDKPLTDEEAAAVAVDETWKSYSLPEPEPVEKWWPDQERRRGVGVSLKKYVGEGKRYHGVATIHSDAARCLPIHRRGPEIGVVERATRVYAVPAHVGWHPGRERVNVKLKEGENRLVIECGSAFFVSLTDGDLESE